MPEQPAQQSAQAFSPNAHFASICHVSGRVAEFHLTFGRFRPVVTAEGQLLSQLATEWLFTVTMPPASVKELAKQLTETVKQYEERYGAIAEEKPAA